MNGPYHNRFSKMPDELQSEATETTSTQTKHLSDKSGTTIDVKEMAAAEPEWKPKTKEMLIMITVSVASLVVAIDATILVPVLPVLALDLHGSAADAFWTGTSYLLAHSVLQPTMASFSDIFGRREVLVPSILFFSGGSVICATAHAFTAMLVGRVVQGIGGAGIICISQQVFADMVPLRVRPKYFTMVLGAWAVGSVSGPLIGGLLVDKTTWRWCFWINLPICGLALPMSFFLGQLSQPKKDLVTKLRAIDWSGNTIFIASLTSLLVGISWAGIQYEWSSYQTILPLVLGGVGLIGSVYFEMKISKKPFLEKSVFNSISSIASFACALIQGLVLYMALYYFAFYFTSTHFYSAIRTGYSLIPATACLLPGSSVTSALIARLGFYRPFIWVGFVISTIASGCLMLWDQSTSIPVWAACECFFGAGMGMILSSVSVAIQAAVEPEYSSQAASMYAFMRSIGMAVGVAIGGTVFQNVMKHKLVQLSVPHAVEIAKNSEGFLEQFRHLATTGPEGIVRDNIMSGYVHGFRGAFITMTAFCVAGILASTLIKHQSLDRGLKSRFRVNTFHQV